jgi:hypothetical protein
VCGDSFRQLPQGKQKLRATSGAQPANEQQHNPIMKRAAFLFFLALALLKLNSAVGVASFFDYAERIKSTGIQCALGHSTVDDSFAPPPAAGLKPPIRFL